MKRTERINIMKNSDSFAEFLSESCDVSLSKGQEMVSRVNTLENFFSDYFNRNKPRKMAIVYVLKQNGVGPRTAAKLTNQNTSGSNSLSEDLAISYLEEIKDLINKELDIENNKNWTKGDEVYEPRKKDPLKEYFDIESQGRNAKLGSF